MGCAGSTPAERAEETTTKKLRKPKPWKHTQPITREQLKQMCEEFWDTAPHYGGKKEIWDALRAAAEADLDLAQTIVESAGIIVSNADMTVCYDERGAKGHLKQTAAGRGQTFQTFFFPVLLSCGTRRFFPINTNQDPDTKSGKAVSHPFQWLTREREIRQPAPIAISSPPMAARADTSQLPFLLLLLLFASTMCIAFADGVRRGVLAYVPVRKRPAGGKATAGADCRAMVSRVECLGRSEWCRWCRSDAVDDMCFGSAEAWRLPRQIFSCEAPGA